MKTLLIATLALASFGSVASEVPQTLMVDDNSFSGKTTAFYFEKTNVCAIESLDRKGENRTLVTVDGDKNIRTFYTGDFTDVTKITLKYINTKDYSEFINKATDSYMEVGINHPDPVKAAKFIMNSADMMGTTTVYMGMKATIVEAKFSNAVEEVFFNCVNTIAK